MEQQWSENSERAAPAARRLLRTPLVVGALVAVLGLLATSGVVAVLAADTRDEVAAELDRTAADIDVQVTRRLEAAESALLTLAAQMSTGTTAPSEMQWVLANTQVVEEVPGLLAVLYARATTTAGALRVAPRAIHPLNPNVGVLGRNLMTDPETARAIRAARDDGRTTATSVVTHADGDVDAILVVAPVYEGATDSIAARRDAFTGATMAVVSPAGLFAEVGNLPVVAEIQDLGATNVVPRPVRPLTEVWSSDQALPPTVRTSTFRFADRTWQVVVGPGDRFPVSGVSEIVVVAGVLLSALLGVVTALLVGRRERLEQLVAARTRDLQRANEELERAGRLRSQFITTVSHELRTPLTSVLGFIQTVRRLDDEQASVREDFLARAERNGLLLRRMIEELLDFGRLERGDMVLHRMHLDVGGAVDDMVRDIRPALAGRELVVRAEGDVRASVDPDALERIVANLLSNAVVHAPGAGCIQLCIERHHDMVEIACCDRGPGFLAEDIPVLLERFVRGSGVMGEGTGLGLALVRELAVAHGGQVELRNRDRGGAAVIVRLPAGAPPPDGAAAAAEGPAAVGSRS